MARYNRASPPMMMSFEVKDSLSLISIRHDIPPNVASPVSVDVVTVLSVMAAVDVTPQLVSLLHRPCFLLLRR